MCVPEQLGTCACTVRIAGMVPLTDLGLVVEGSHYTVETKKVILVHQGFPQQESNAKWGGRGLGGICDHMIHFYYHIKDIRILKAWGGGGAMLKGPG